MYQNGIVMESGTAYLGIETGAVLIGASRRLEFVGEAICNSKYPYRKNPISRNVPIDEKDKFLIWLFGGFCGRDSGIGPAQRAKTTIWN